MPRGLNAIERETWQIRRPDLSEAEHERLQAAVDDIVRAEIAVLDRRYGFVHTVVPDSGESVWARDRLKGPDA